MQADWGDLSKTQRRILTAIAVRDREYAAADVTNLALERLGMIRRLAEHPRGRLMAHPTIMWTITDTGQAALAEFETVR